MISCIAKPFGWVHLLSREIDCVESLFLGRIYISFFPLALLITTSHTYMSKCGQKELQGIMPTMKTILI